MSTGRSRRLRRWVPAAILAALTLLPGSRVARADDYVLDEGDVLLVTVFGHGDLTTTARIDREGRILLPLVGQVAVAGLSPAGASDLVAARLADGFIVAPQVTVQVKERRSRRVNVIGSLNRPGVYEFQGGLTLLELLSRAGGLAADAGAEAVLTRRAGGEPVTVDLRALLAMGDTTLDVPIDDGDSLFVPEAGSYFLTGEVRRPGAYRHEAGMTLIRALTLAGGFTERAAADRVKVIREGPGGAQSVLDHAAGAGFEAPVQPGDIILVGLARAEVCYVTGEVKNAGAYRCDRGTTVLKAVTLAGGFAEGAARGRVRIVRRTDGRERVLERVGLEESVLPDDILVVPRSFF